MEHSALQVPRRRSSTAPQPRALRTAACLQPAPHACNLRPATHPHPATGLRPATSLHPAPRHQAAPSHTPAHCPHGCTLSTRLHPTRPAPPRPAPPRPAPPRASRVLSGRHGGALQHQATHVAGEQLARVKAEGAAAHKSEVRGLTVQLTNARHRLLREELRHKR
eukprot:840090-Prymnesium_polylepis.1